MSTERNRASFYSCLQIALSCLTVKYVLGSKEAALDEFNYLGIGRKNSDLQQMLSSPSSAPVNDEFVIQP